MIEDGKLFIGRGDLPVSLLLKYGNRHGIVTGATGTGKTVTLQILAEGFADAGVPVFCADVKGDLSGIAAAGEPKPALVERANGMGIDPYVNAAAPVVFWDLLGEKGHPIRTTVSEMGPLLLSRLLDLNDVQEGVLNIVFKLADDEGLLLLDLKDLRSLLTYVGDNAATIATRYGQVAKASIGAVQRSLLVLEQQNGERFFGEPALEIGELLRTTREGRGIVNVLAADKLMQNPRLYATFLLWLLSELFEELPEVGDPDRPRLVFFFDEAHLLFTDAPQALLEKIEQVVKLVRSKGVGVYFVTQNPLDVPDAVLAQLGNRIQHALRAYTPREEKAVRTAADTFRPNPAFNTFETITQLGVGEALVSVLEAGAVPSIVERTKIRPPASRIGPLTDSERQAVMAASPLAGRYEKIVDRESAYEILAERADKQAQAKAAEEAQRAETQPSGGGRTTTPRASNRESALEATIKSIGRSVGSQVGRQIGRSILRGIFGSLVR
jgi:DNA helicase HerA-like ATPase